jgi:hypothetical protein
VGDPRYAPADYGLRQNRQVPVIGSKYSKPEPAKKRDPKERTSRDNLDFDLVSRIIELDEWKVPKRWKAGGCLFLLYCCPGGWKKCGGAPKQNPKVKIPPEKKKKKKGIST